MRGIKRARQTGKSKTSADKKLLARFPGKRRSKSGKTYYESRRNRSDVNRKKKL